MVFSKKTLVATVIVLSFAVVGGLPTMVFASGSSSIGGGNIGGTTSTPECDSVVKYKNSTGDALNGFAFVKSSITLASSCASIAGIYVTVTNNLTGVTTGIWSGWFAGTYGFNARWDNAEFNTPYTITVYSGTKVTSFPIVLTPPAPVI